MTLSAVLRKGSPSDGWGGDYGMEKYPYSTPHLHPNPNNNPDLSRNDNPDSYHNSNYDRIPIPNPQPSLAPTQSPNPNLTPALAPTAALTQTPMLLLEATPQLV